MNEIFELFIVQLSVGIFGIILLGLLFYLLSELLPNKLRKKGGNNKW